MKVGMIENNDVGAQRRCGEMDIVSDPRSLVSVSLICTDDMRRGSPSQLEPRRVEHVLAEREPRTASPRPRPRRRVMVLPNVVVIAVDVTRHAHVPEPRVVVMQRVLRLRVVLLVKLVLVLVLVLVIHPERVPNYRSGGRDGRRRRCWRPRRGRAAAAALRCAARGPRRVGRVSAVEHLHPVHRTVVRWRRHHPLLMMMMLLLLAVRREERGHSRRDAVAELLLLLRLLLLLLRPHLLLGSIRSRGAVAWDEHALVRGDVLHRGRRGSRRLSLRWCAQGPRGSSRGRGEQGVSNRREVLRKKKICSR